MKGTIKIDKKENRIFQSQESDDIPPMAIPRTQTTTSMFVRLSSAKIKNPENPHIKVDNTIRMANIL